MAGFPVGSATVGSMVDQLRLITTPAEFTWEGIDARLRSFLQTTPPIFAWEAVDGNFSTFFTTIPPEFSFVGEGGVVSATAITTPSLVEWTVDNGIVSARLITLPSEFDFVGQDAEVRGITIGVPPSFVWVGQDGESSAEGAISVTSSPAVFEFVGSDAEALYNIDITDIPNLIVTRVGTTVTIDVDNPNDTPLFIYKAPETKSGFELLVNAMTLPYVDTVVETTSPKYKASFGITGNIAGQPVKFEGRKSTSRYSRNE